MQILSPKPKLYDAHSTTKLFIPRHQNQSEMKKIRFGYKLRETGVNAWLSRDDENGFEYDLVDYKGRKIVHSRKMVRNLVCNDFGFDPCMHESVVPSIHVYENKFRNKVVVANHAHLDDNYNILYSFLNFSGYDVKDFCVTKYDDNTATSVAVTCVKGQNERPTDNFLKSYLEENLF